VTIRIRSAFWIFLWDHPTELDPDEMTLDHVRGALRDGPPTTSRKEAIAR